jgi:hypothetical protein
MLPDQTALALFHREVLLPEVKRVVDEAVAPLQRRPVEAATEGVE